MYIAKPTTNDLQELKDAVPGKDLMPIVQATGSGYTVRHALHSD